MRKRAYISSKYFQSVIESADYNSKKYGFSENFHRYMKDPFYDGLIAGGFYAGLVSYGNVNEKSLSIEDVQNFGCIFQYELDDIAESESFTLGFYVSYLGGSAPAVKKFIGDDEEYNRIAEYRRSKGESVTVDNLKNNEVPIGLIDALALINSYIEDEQTYVTK